MTGRRLLAPLIIITLAIAGLIAGSKQPGFLSLVSWAPKPQSADYRLDRHQSADSSASAQGQVRRVWSRRLDRGFNDSPVRAETDGRGNIYVLSLTTEFEDDEVGHERSFWLVKYAPDGKKLWGRRYDSGPGADDVVGLALDGRGGVFIAGATASGENGDETQDFVLVKFDADGRRLWVRRYDGPTSGRDTLVDLAVDLAGNAYVTGASWVSGQGDVFSIVKYDGNGRPNWENQFAGEQRTNAVPVGLAVDSQGSVYVTGIGRNKPANFDIITLKYDRSGALIWQRDYDGGSDDFAQTITLDRQDNIYVAGRVQNSGDWRGDMGLIKYDPQGGLVWANHYDGPVGADDTPVAVAIDGDGNAFVTGFQQNIRGAREIVTIKYDAVGTQLWAQNLPGPVFSESAPLSLKLDQQGNAYVAGWMIRDRKNLPLGLSYPLIKYSPSGKAEWNQEINGEGFEIIPTFKFEDGGKADIALGREGQVYLICGISKTMNDVLLIKFSTD